MKRLFLAVFVLLGIIFGAGQVSAVNVDSFTISKFDIEMTLSRDVDKRSVLKTTETITAVFPNYDQNHGLERVFVKTYKDHSVNLTIDSVTDEIGNKLPYHWSGDALRIGDANTYVYGSKTYVIKYTQHDVTNYYAETNRDEFYWDLIGVNWRVPISNIHIVLVLTDDIAKSKQSKFNCYTGYQGQNNNCEVVETPGGMTLNIASLSPNQAVTVAVGFEAGTFSPYKMSVIEMLIILLVIWQFVSLALGVIFIAFVIRKHHRIIEREHEIGTIIPEYLPPKEFSVSTSAKIGGYRHATMTAQLIDLAVRHHIKITELSPKTLFRAAEYEIEILKDPKSLKVEEEEILDDLFSGMAKKGDVLDLYHLKNDPSYRTRLLNNDSKLEKLIRNDYGLREENSQHKAWAKKTAIIFGIIGVLVLSLSIIITAIVVFVLSFNNWRLTDKGLELKRYLKGLKLYIGVAEEKRLQMLQSPEGAEKVASVANGIEGAQLVKLYERVLPYAVLFGQEKQWAKRLGDYYEQTGVQPDWYVGQSNVFSSAAFSAAMSSLNSSSSSYSGTSDSSSSGGSDGGGFSGGGGGGGGGGGW